ncbi:hypothetical protein DXV65_19390 [Pseudomonas fluorescens]|nr:hypothetical protein DXV65_19390 [Pseudomonas fluorescens]
MGCEAAPVETLRFLLKELMSGLGAASQPNAGQACSPQGSDQAPPNAVTNTTLACNSGAGHDALFVAELEVGCCGEQACPALGCEAAPVKTLRFFLKKLMSGLGAASQPNAGQACSPQGSDQAPPNAVTNPTLTCNNGAGYDTIFVAELEVGCCGEQACPALGCEAVPVKTLRFLLKEIMSGLGAASQPNAGQACSPQGSA